MGAVLITNSQFVNPELTAQTCVIICRKAVVWQYGFTCRIKNDARELRDVSGAIVSRVVVKNWGI